MNAKVNIYLSLRRDVKILLILKEEQMWVWNKTRIIPSYFLRWLVNSNVYSHETVFGLHVLEKLRQTDRSVEALLFFVITECSHKELSYNSPKGYCRRKEHRKLHVLIYLLETSECHWERKWTRTSVCF